MQIEFPSILLPPNISSGSIVDITVARNVASEAESQAAFTQLQHEVYTTFGQQSPAPPELRCRNATQTSVVLEWDPIQLATARLRSLSLYRNGAKAGNIPRPLETQSTKISGLAIDTEYTFHLMLRTSAGTYSSQKLAVTTHKMTDLSGITVTPGVLAPPLRESLVKALDRIGAKLADTVRIDTTHFVCTEGKGQQWERAVELNIPVVRPEWLDGCEREGRIVGVREYYLNADPRLRQIGQGVRFQQQPSSPQRPEHHPRSFDHQEPRRIPNRTSSKQQDLSRDSQDETSTVTTGSVQSVNNSIQGGDGNSSDEDDDDIGESSKRPPTPPPKDERFDLGPPEPKSVGDDEPKVRLEDRARLGRPVNNANANIKASSDADTDVNVNGNVVERTNPQQPHQEQFNERDNNNEEEDEEERGRTARGGAVGGGRVVREVDGESFSEVAL